MARDPVVILARNSNGRVIASSHSCMVVPRNDGTLVIAPYTSGDPEARCAVAVFGLGDRRILLRHWWGWWDNNPGREKVVPAPWKERYILAAATEYLYELHPSLFR